MLKGTDRKTGKDSPLLMERPDRSGTVKAKTLEFFVENPGGHSVTELAAYSVLANPLAEDGGEMAIRMRLLRYARQGLLSRRREGRRFVFEITEGGERRLFNLWERLGLVDPFRVTSPEARQAMTARLQLKLSVLRERHRTLEVELS